MRNRDKILPQDLRIPNKYPLTVGTRYRSLLTDTDHLLGRDQVWRDDETAWCGFALGAARDWDEYELGGLWFSERTSALCTKCKTRDTEWLNARN